MTINISMMSLFFFFGTIFFITWFVFLVVATAVMIVLNRRAQELQVLIEEKMDTPQSQTLMSLIPLIPSLVNAGRRMRGKS